MARLGAPAHIPVQECVGCAPRRGCSMLPWDKRSGRKSTPRRWRRRLSRPTLERLEERVVPAALLVTNTDDGGPGSLRQAILDANANLGPDTIRFAVNPDDARHFYYRDDGVAGQVSQSLIAQTS